jgi:hypothetical protein
MFTYMGVRIVSVTSKIIVVVLAVVSMSTMARSDVVAKKPYQLQVITPCNPNAFCEVNFPTLTERVLVRHVSCVIAATSIEIVEVDSRHSDSTTYGAEYQHPFVVPGESGSGSPLYGFNSDAYLYGEKGGYFAVIVSGTPTDVLQCTLSGDYI